MSTHVAQQPVKTDLTIVLHTSCGDPLVKVSMPIGTHFETGDRFEAVDWNGQGFAGFISCIAPSDHDDAILDIDLEDII